MSAASNVYRAMGSGHRSATFYGLELLGHHGRRPNSGLVRKEHRLAR